MNIKISESCRIRHIFVLGQLCCRCMTKPPYNIFIMGEDLVETKKIIYEEVIILMFFRIGWIQDYNAGTLQWMSI